MGLFQRAVKQESKLRLAIAGPSGSGKTYTALAIGCALANGGPVALVDTEHGSASKYADLFEFDVANMHAPYHPDKFGKAIQEAADAGYKVIILDSLTHAWNGEGGLLDLVEEFARRMKNANSFAAWKDATPIQNRMIESIVGAPIHVIMTMRSKQEYVLQDDGRGRQTPKKVGMAPVQREGMEYEADIFLDMDMENNAIVQKTRCPDLTGRVFSKPGADVADILKQWLQGAPVTMQAEATQSQAQPEPAPAAMPTNGKPAPKPAAKPAQKPQAAQNGDKAQDNPFLDESSDSESLTPATANGNAPSQAELTIIGDWSTPADAHAWAVEHGHCENAPHAQKRFANVVREQFDNKLSKQNMAAAMLAFLRACNAVETA